MKALAAALIVVALPVQAATLTVHVGNIDKKGGIIRLSLYDEFTWSAAHDDPLASANDPAVAPETVITLKNIKPGVYGIKCYQDANKNDKFDQNFLGLPQERYGFSRDAKPFLSEPVFNRTKVIVSDGENEITIHLQ